MSISQTIETLTGADQFFEVVDLETPAGSLPGFKHAPSTLIEIVQNARGHGVKDFIIAGDVRLSFSKFFDRADRLRSYLETNGLERGQRFAIAMRNSPEWLIGFTAALLAGAIVVPINSWGRYDELAFAIEDSQADWLLCDDQRAKTIEDLLDTNRRLVVFDRAEPGSVRGIDFETATADLPPADVVIPPSD